MARYDKLGHELQKIFEEKYGCRFLCNELPRGFSQTASWLRKIGKLYGKEKDGSADADILTPVFRWYPVF